MGLKIVILLIHLPNIGDYRLFLPGSAARGLWTCPREWAEPVGPKEYSTIDEWSFHIDNTLKFSALEFRKLFTQLYHLIHSSSTRPRTVTGWLVGHAWESSHRLLTANSLLSLRVILPPFFNRGWNILSDANGWSLVWHRPPQWLPWSKE